MAAPYLVAGLAVTDRCLAVPVDWEDPDGQTLTVFVREVAAASKRDEELPLLVYLQGGPGGKSPRPTGVDGWLPAAVERFRVLLVDQRGTGRSSRVEGRTIARMPPAEAARYLACFRADSIVNDLEAIRTRLYDGCRWSTLGQSFGGFVTLTYLSTHPEALRSCCVAGGLASLEPSAAEVYQRTYPRVAEKTRRYYQRFPDDLPRVAAIADRLAAGDVRLPDGDPLTVERFQSLGIDLGMAPGAARIHWLVDEALGPEGEPTETFLAQAMALSGYRDNPLFMVLQEAIYGHGAGATGWAAQAERERRPEFATAARPLLFTGEMMFPWMLEQVGALRPFAAAARLLAERPEWPLLYDPVRLAANEVPVAAVIYDDDMYVDSGLSRLTATAVGNLEAWVTNEYEHDGLHGGRVLPRLLAMIDAEGGPR